MSRVPRGTCPGAGLTKTEQLRQAKTAALVRNIAQREETAARQVADSFKVRRRIARPEPKKVDFTKPGLTKSMVARMKQAEKFKQEYERKREAVTTGRVPKRTLAPIGGDARMGRETLSPLPRMPPVGSPRPALTGIPRRDAIPKRLKPPEQIIPKKTAEIAKVMNADVIQAEAVGTGPVTNIVLPPGVVNEERTTIVNIVTPGAGAAVASTAGASNVANRSIQVISKALNEQDANENAAVQSKLVELQQARRDFVMAVANVGGNAVRIDDEAPPSMLLYNSVSPRSAMYTAPTPRHIVKLPDVQDRSLRPKYGQDHPDILAARAHMQKTKAEMEAREAARRMEEEFERIAAAEQLSDQLQLDIPFDEELFLERDISWEEDEMGMAMPRPSRVKAHVPPVPQQQQVYHHEPFDPEELERFFDIEQFPPCTHCGPPPGREGLNPDLWELDDPWYIPPPCDEPDLIQFD